MASVKNWVELVISMMVGVTATMVNLNWCGFVLNMQLPYLVPSTVDISLGSSYQLVASPLWNNLLLLFIFLIQHSGMIRGPVNSLLRKFLSKENTRVCFVAITCIYVRFLFSFWAPMPYLVWSTQHQRLSKLICGVSLLCWCSMFLSLLNLDAYALFGIRSHLDKILDRKTEVTFVSTGLYAFVRHPVYAFLMLGLWITPAMTVGHVLFSSVLTAYILFAVTHFEEPDLVRDIGPEYVQYMKTTPRYIPNFLTSKFIDKDN